MKLFGSWPTALLRVAVALGSLVLVGALVLTGFWGAVTQLRKPGDPLDFSASGFASGFLLLPLFGVVGAVMGFLMGFLILAVPPALFRRTSGARRPVRGITTWEATVMGAWSGVWIVLLGLFWTAGQLMWIVEHRVVSFADKNVAAGLAAAAAAVVIGGLSLSCGIVLGQRTVRVSDRFADRRFPLLVGAVALTAAVVAAGVAASGDVGEGARWALFGGAWAVAWLCLSCLVVEFVDRASSTASYVGGAAMTLGAGAGSVTAFVLL